MREKLLKASSVVSLMTLLSRVLGLVRDIVIAGLLGGGMAADAFFVAQKIPNFVRRLSGEGAFAQAFVPVLADYKSRSIHDVRTLLAHVFGTMVGILLPFTLLGMLAAPLIILLFASGFINEPLKFQMAADMLTITFPYVLLISLVAFSSAILNSYGHFAVPAATPVILNICLMTAALYFASNLSTPVYALAWALPIAGLLQLAFQLPFLSRMGFLSRPRWGWRDPGVQRILLLMAPALFGVSVGQLNMLLDTILASWLETGSVSWLYFSDRLLELPLGVLGIAIATVILPGLATHHVSRDPEAFSQTLMWAIKLLALVGLPAMLGLCLLAEPLMITLFQRGAFSAHDANMAANSLIAYALGLLPLMWIKVLAPGYFARQDTKTPVRIGIIAMVANMVLNLALIYPLAHVGLALATSLSGILNAGLLFRGLQKQGLLKSNGQEGAFWLRLLSANLLLGLLLFYAVPEVALWLSWGIGQRVGTLAIILCGAILIYSLSLLAVGMRWSHVK